ncbi:hypothetical protein [Nonomuraea sp. NPDC050691]|uniref:hypothetical protein n=1 Tax=Nonomuraea sp. NPDC050691 TaxID=3155661 RepID=UPI0033FDBF04
MKSDETAGTVEVVAALLVDLLLLATASFVVGRAPDRGLLCDGASVLCSGGDRTQAQWLAETSFRSTAAYTSYAVVALVVIALAVVGWRRGRRAVVVMQGAALAVVTTLAVLWQPYPQVV